jgi:hypothetical protein
MEKKQRTRSLSSIFCMLMIFTCLFSPISILAQTNLNFEELLEAHRNNPPEGTDGNLLDVFNQLKEINTYCDKGTFSENRQNGRFERCFTRSGEYIEKIYFDNRLQRREIKWSDGTTDFLYKGRLENGILKTISYTESPVRVRKRNADYSLADLILERINIDLLAYPNDLFLPALGKYRINESLSSSDTVVLDYERLFSDGEKSGEVKRIWISTADSIVTKAAVLWHSELRSYWEVSEYSLNQKLENAELVYEEHEMLYREELEKQEKKERERQIATNCLLKNQESNGRFALQYDENKQLICSKLENTTAENQDEIYDSPEKVWLAFQNFLQDGDAKSAIKCLTAKASRDFSPILDAMSTDELAEMANIGKLVVTSHTDKIAVGFLSNELGMVGSVRFSSVAGNWKISSM